MQCTKQSSAAILHLPTNMTNIMKLDFETWSMQQMTISEYFKVIS